MLAVLKSVVFIYVISALLLFLLQRQFLYFPTQSVLLSNEKEITFDHDGIQLRGWLVNPGQKKDLLYYGGNAESIDINIPFFRQYLSEYTVYLVAYRGYGDSTGKPSEEHLLHDAEYIYEQISPHHSKVSLMGRSLGAGIAIWLASRKKVSRLILVTPYDSILNVAKKHYAMYPISLLLWDKFEAIRYSPDISCPTTIFAAQNDIIIPWARTQALIDSFVHIKPQVFIINGTAHNSIAMAPEYITKLRQVFK